MRSPMAMQSVGVDPGTEDHGTDCIAIGERILEGSKNYYPATLAANVAIGTLIERKTASAAGKHRGRAKSEIRIGGQQQVDPADNCRRDSFGADCLTGVMQGDERRRAGRVDR